MNGHRSLCCWLRGAASYCRWTSFSKGICDSRSPQGPVISTSRPRGVRLRARARTSPREEKQVYSPNLVSRQFRLSSSSPPMATVKNGSRSRSGGNWYTSDSSLSNPSSGNEAYRCARESGGGNWSTKRNLTLILSTDGHLTAGHHCGSKFRA